MRYLFNRFTANYNFCSDGELSSTPMFVFLAKKVKVQRNRPEGPKGGRDITLLFPDLGARRGGWSAPLPGRFTPGKDPVPIVQEAGWAPGPVWMGAKNLVPTGIRSPDRPARSQSLYRLSYPGSHVFLAEVLKL
jgi:hypothetical protein